MQVEIGWSEGITILLLDVVARSGAHMVLTTEGLDASWKQTQAGLLSERFRRHGLRSERLSFPCSVNTHFGARIGEYLDMSFEWITGAIWDSLSRPIAARSPQVIHMGSQS